MNFCQELDLLSASPIEIPQVCTVLPILLSRFKGIGGAENYQHYRRSLSLLAMSTEDLVEFITAVGIIEKPSPEVVAKLTQFGLLTSIPFLRELLIDSLSFFIQEEVLWDDNLRAVRCLAPGGKAANNYITPEIYTLVRRVVLETNCIPVEKEESEEKFSNSKAQEIFEKLKAGRKRKKTTDVTAGPSIADVISSVCVRGGYTLLNVWDLSIYQLYDQFARIDVNHQLDVYGLRWAAWGTEPFDFTLWWKNNNKEDENV